MTRGEVTVVQQRLERNKNTIHYISMGLLDLYYIRVEFLYKLQSRFGSQIAILKCVTFRARAIKYYFSAANIYGIY